MIRKKNNVIGGYNPSFFEMEVNCSTNNFDLNKMSDKDLTVLFHEYVHFLQDITTYCGLNNFYVNNEYLCSVLNRIYKQAKSSSFTVPYTISDNRDNVLLNKQCRDVIVGDSDLPEEIVISSISDVKIDDFELMPNPLLKSIKGVTLYLKNDKGEDEFYSFGEIAIAENMAYIMERLCSPNDYITSPDFPYTVAEKVSDFYVPGFSNNLEMVLALCDMCLMTSNPGQVYVEVMQGIQRKNLKFKKPEEIYDHFYSLKSKSVYKEEVSFIDGYKRILEFAITKMKGYLKDIPQITNDYYEWIDTVNKFSVDCRENYKYFFLGMARDGNLKTNQSFINIINRIGSPIITNNQKKYFKIPHSNSSQPRTDVEYFKAIGQIVKLFETGEMSCNLHEWCKNSPSNPTNCHCLNDPWNKCSENNLCFYAMFWKHWNLSGYTPTK